MKSLRIVGVSILILLFAGCRQATDCRLLIATMESDLAEGNISRVGILADSLKSSCGTDTLLVLKADSLSQIAERTALDFSVTEDETLERMEQRIGSFTRAQKDEWEKKGLLEYRIIDGRKMYFNRAASNLALLLKFAENRNGNRTGKESVNSPEIAFRLDHASKVIKASDLSPSPVEPAMFAITYSLTLNADAVPDGETVRCWLPYPRSDSPRQGEVKLIETSEREYIISPDSLLHKTIYMEKTATSGLPTEFNIRFSYSSAASYFNLTEMTVGKYDIGSDIYKKYTVEQAPHIVFTEDVRNLADSIAPGETDPLTTVRKIYLWFKENIPWAGALEYSIMPDIPGYVIKNRRGDCGMQTFLFMSMLRYKGIPVRWQSGWMVPPEAENLHDWCEIWYEGIGWVPADISYDLLPSSDAATREFYMSGIDAYRLIVNEGVSGNLYPAKKYLRSEPYDFQRGEVEWKGGNLYFDKWDYDMQIEYLK